MLMESKLRNSATVAVDCKLLTVPVKHVELCAKLVLLNVKLQNLAGSALLKTLNVTSKIYVFFSLSAL